MDTTIIDSERRFQFFKHVAQQMVKIGLLMDRTTPVSGSAPVQLGPADLGVEASVSAQGLVVLGGFYYSDVGFAVYCAKSLTALLPLQQSCTRAVAGA